MTKGERDRSAQKRRTRQAILGAAVELMRQNETPTASRVAELAEVSRRTVYVYFPTQEQLLTDAALEGVRDSVDRALDTIETDDVWSRLDAVVDVTLESCLKYEVQLRTMVRLTIEQRLAEARGDRRHEVPLRGRRRLEWIETALAPVRDKLTNAHFERLVSALSVCVGFEALLVLRDIRGLDMAEIKRVSSWTARALLREALEECE